MQNFLSSQRFETKTLYEADATEDNIDTWLLTQQFDCLNERKNNRPNEKFVLLCYYSGHGYLNSGTQHVNLPSCGYALESEVRNFSAKNNTNSYVIGIFDACRTSSDSASRAPP